MLPPRATRALTRSEAHTTGKVRIVVAHVFPLLAEAIGVLLERAGFEVPGFATTATVVKELLEQCHPDLLVCDANMPEVDPTFVHALAQQFPGMRFLLLAGSTEPNGRAGWTGNARVTTVSALAPARTVLAHIRQLFRGRQGAAANKLQPSSHLRAGNPIASLTKRERQILQLVASGLTVRTVADRLGLAPSTVDNHKARIMKKLGVHKVAELTRIAMRAGLID